MRRFLNHLLDLAFPGVCPACSAAYQGPGPLCAGCDQKLHRLIDEPECAACAKPRKEHNAPCAYCLGKGVPHYERIVRLGGFRDPLKTLIHHLKYRRRWPLGEQLADRLLEKASVDAVLKQADCLVAVPLYRWRQFSRGYNQAGVVAGRLASRCDIPIVRPVIRVRNTETQTSLHSRTRREENLRDAFRLTRPQAVAGRHVVVVDDVMTTGATLQALARTLGKARPASLSAIVLGVADPRSPDFTDTLDLNLKLNEKNRGQPVISKG